MLRGTNSATLEDSRYRSRSTVSSSSSLTSSAATTGRSTSTTTHSLRYPTVAAAPPCPPTVSNISAGNNRQPSVTTGGGVEAPPAPSTPNNHASDAGKKSNKKTNDAVITSVVGAGVMAFAGAVGYVFGSSSKAKKKKKRKEEENKKKKQQQQLEKRQQQKQGKALKSNNDSTTKESDNMVKEGNGQVTRGAPTINTTTFNSEPATVHSSASSSLEKQSSSGTDAHPATTKEITSLVPRFEGDLRLSNSELSVGTSPSEGSASNLGSVTNPQSVTSTPNSDRFLDFGNREVSIKDLDLDPEPFSEGYFSKVHRGDYEGMDVAVKFAKLSYASSKILESNESNDAPSQISTESQKAMDMLHAEVEIMNSFPRHRNIVEFLGAVRGKQFGLLTRYCPSGSAESLLYKDSDRCSGAVISAEKRVGIAAEAATGIAHLHNHNVIHHDIAARNILIESLETWRVRVSDFGLSEVEDTGRQAGKYKTCCPKAWLAPEAFKNGKLNKKSDVFAFGVVLYELFSGERPWKNEEDTEIEKRVCSGERLSFPLGCPPIEELALRCWRENPEDRPTMKEVEEELQKYYAILKECETQTDNRAHYPQWHSSKYGAL